MNYEELSKCHGRKFKATIDGKSCEGKITVEDGTIYLCQNVEQGGYCEDKQGYECSWQYMRKDGYIDISVKDFQLIVEDNIMKYEDLKEFHGKRFKATICGTECEGRITVEEDRIFLCQNVKKGDYCKDKQGYRYSWFYMAKYGFGSLYVKDFQLIEEEVIEPNIINPNHYKQNSKEVYEMMIDIWGIDAFKLHCEMTAFKYRMRCGLNDNNSVEQDIAKAKWYENKINELNNK